MRRDNRSQSFCGGLVTCIIIFCCAGPALIIAGIVMLASSDTRSQNIERYNNAVNEWRLGYHEEFMNQNFFVESQGTAYLLNPDESADSLNDNPRDGETFETYRPLKYRNSRFLLYGDTSFNTASIEREVFSGTTNSSSRSVMRITENTFDTHSFTPSASSSSDDDRREEDRERRRKCENDGGYYESSSSRCTLYFSVEQMCATVRLSSDNENWEPRSGQQGCFQRRFSTSSDTVVMQDWAVSQYQKIRSVSSPPQNVQRSEGIFTLRHLFDPYVVALDLTNGSLDFGLTIGEKRTIGGVLLGIGIVALCPLCCMIIGLVILTNAMGYAFFKFTK